MKFVYFTLVALVSFLGKGFAGEKVLNEFRISLNPEKLLISENGIFLKTADFGEISLTELKYDKRGYYTMCQIAFHCTNCHEQFEIYSNACEHCGSDQLNFIGLEKDTTNEYLTAQAAICVFLNHANIWDNEFLLCKKSLEIAGGIDTDGNKDLSITFKRV